MKTFDQGYMCSFRCYYDLTEANTIVLENTF